MWQDLFFTVVVAYVLFRVLGEYSRRNNRVPPEDPPQPVRKNRPGDDEGEYVDYEEIK